MSIDGAVVPAREIWQEYEYTYSVIGMSHAKPAEYIHEKAFGQAVRQVVVRALLSREAAAKGFALTGQERAALRAREVAGWKGEANFRAALAMLKASEEFLLRRAETTLLARKMVEPEALAGDALAEKAQREFYGANGELYLSNSPALRYLRLPLKADLREFYRERDRLVGEGKDYSWLVKKFSDHESAASGGVVDEAAAPSWPYQQQVGVRIKPCRTSSKPERDAAGLHVYARDCKMPLPFESVRGRVRADLSERLVGARQAALVDRLFKAAVIEYLPGARERVPAGSEATNPSQVHPSQGHP